MSAEPVALYRTGDGGSDSPVPAPSQPRPLKVTLGENFSHYTVLFNGVPHLSFGRRELVGFTTWIDNGKKFVLELHLVHGKITTEYDRMEKLVAVVKVLDAISEW